METAIGLRISELVASVDSLLTDLASLTVSDTDVVASRSLVDKTELLCTHIVARYNADGTFASSGMRDTSAFMAYKSRVLKSEGNSRVKRATLLNDLVLFGKAAVKGEITSAHIMLLANVVTAQRLPYALRDETVLLEQAKKFDATSFKTVLQHWAALCDDVTDNPCTDDEQQARRVLQLRQLLNGMWALNGTLDPETGAALEAALANAQATPTAEDNRTIGQLRHDALGDITRESLNNTDSSAVGTGSPAQVSLIINETDGTAHTPNSYYVTSIHRDLILCDCVTTAIKTCEGVVFDVGTPETAIPTRNRKAIIARDRCCRWPGCDRPARWSEIHHILERTNGGCHQLNNLVLMCRFHHRYVHRQHVKLTWDTDNITLIATLQNGQMLHAPSHPSTLNLQYN
jgi:Domain of unknown function (DUF222)